MEGNREMHLFGIHGRQANPPVTGLQLRALHWQGLPCRHRPQAWPDLCQHLLMGDGASCCNHCLAASVGAVEKKLQARSIDSVQTFNRASDRAPQWMVAAPGRGAEDVV